MSEEMVADTQINNWDIDKKIFDDWVNTHLDNIGHKLLIEPTIKILIFLALLEHHRICTYADLRRIFLEKKVITGNLPENTLRTSAFSLGKTLDKISHELQLVSSRGKFQLLTRFDNKIAFNKNHKQYTALLLESLPFNAETIACELLEKSRLPFHALYFSEWSARWWGIFSHDESQIRVQYETDAWDRLKIKQRLLNNSDEVLSFVSLAPGEGLAEIALLLKILQDSPHKTIHYLAIDTSKRLLREHINLLKEQLASQHSDKQIICVGVIADIFTNLSSAIKQAQEELLRNSIINNANDFLPISSSLLVTYLGNCLGNCLQDQEIEFFSLIRSVFSNSNIEVLVGVSVMRKNPDEYKENWDEFLLQTPKYLLENNNFLQSSRYVENQGTPEFNLAGTNGIDRCPPVIPEIYTARHGISGEIYRFYYKLAYDLFLNELIDKGQKHLPAGSLIMLYNIVKYKIKTLIDGIKASGLFNIEYDQNYHQIINTPNGEREYAVFSAYCK
jgi:Histidine-specific methyltransferase, SAM-dependent